MKTKLIDLTSTKTSITTLPEDLFAGPVNPNIIAQYVRVYQARQRLGSASAQNRGEVNKTTAKVWRQKGTGRARHGSRRAPIFVGGGQAHGPKVIKPNSLTLSKKTKRQAFISALSSQADHVVVVQNFHQLESKTAKINQTLQSKLDWQPSQKLLLVLHDSNLDQIKAISNLKNITTTQAHRLNAFEILNSHLIAFTNESLNILKDLHQSKQTTSQAKKSTNSTPPTKSSTTTKSKSSTSSKTKKTK